MTVLGHEVEIRKEAAGRIIHVDVAGKLTKEDYIRFVPEIENEIETYGTVRLLFELVGFRGWTVPALVEDARFGFKHHKQIERLAFVGDKRWEKAMASFCKPFTRAEVRYYDIADIEAAKTWLREGI